MKLLWKGWFIINKLIEYSKLLCFVLTDDVKAMTTARHVGERIEDIYRLTRCQWTRMCLCYPLQRMWWGRLSLWNINIFVVNGKSISKGLKDWRKIIEEGRVILVGCLNVSLGYTNPAYEGKNTQWDLIYELIWSCYKGSWNWSNY